MGCYFLKNIFINTACSLDKKKKKMLNKTPDMQNAVQNVLLYTKFMNNHNFPGKFQMGLKKKKKVNVCDRTLDSLELKFDSTIGHFTKQNQERWSLQHSLSRKKHKTGADSV